MSYGRNIPRDPWNSSTKSLSTSQSEVSNELVTNSKTSTSSMLPGHFNQPMNQQITWDLATYGSQGQVGNKQGYGSFSSIPDRGSVSSQYITETTTMSAHSTRPTSIWSSDPVYAIPQGSYSSPGLEYRDMQARSSTSSRHQSWDAATSPEWIVSGSSQFQYDNNNCSAGGFKGKGTEYHHRKPSNRDEFDGPHQILDAPISGKSINTERELPHLATNLFVNEQDEILTKVNDRLSRCAFDFVARYQFPIPIESDKRPVHTPADREWTEWVYLLKRLATKRRIPARVLYNGQIKQLITILENSLEMRHAAKHQSRPLKDDRNVLQLISAGLQVAKILKDADAMGDLDQLYNQTEGMIQVRKNNPGYIA